MDNHHPSICTEDDLQYKHRSSSALSSSTPFLRIAPESWWFVLQAWWLCHSVILPKNEKSRWHNNWWGFQQSFLKAAGLAWIMAGSATVCFGATHRGLLTISICTGQTYSSSQSIFQTWSLAWLERLNSGRHYWVENIFWSGTTFFPS